MLGDLLGRCVIAIGFFDDAKLGSALGISWGVTLGCAESSLIGFTEGSVGNCETSTLGDLLGCSDVGC
jgi:hypothetical protein